MIIAGKRTPVRKMKNEPRRCLKCQILDAGHMAAQCESQNTCGTCGDCHLTSECEVTDRDLFKCANCKTSGHASWDRECPKFKEGCKKIDTANPESTYRFFPLDEPWTWEQSSFTGIPPAGSTPNGEHLHNSGRATHGTGPMRQPRPSWADEVEAGWSSQQFSQPNSSAINSSRPSNTQQPQPSSSQPHAKQGNSQPSGSRSRGSNPQIGSQDKGWQRPPLLRQTTILEHVNSQARPHDSSQNNSPPLS